MHSKLTLLFPDPQHKLWACDKSAASIVPGSITTFFLRHSTPKSASATNPGFDVVVFPSNSRYLLEGFVFPVKAGVFGVKFFPVTSGEYKVSVKLEDDNIGNSPFVLTSEIQKHQKEEEEDILDMIDKSTDRSTNYDSNNTSVNTSINTSADTSTDSTDFKNNKNINKNNTKNNINNNNYSNKNTINNNKNINTNNNNNNHNNKINNTKKSTVVTPNTKKKNESLLSPFSFVDHVARSDKDTDESFGSKEGSEGEEEEEEMERESKAKETEYEPTQALESGSDTSFEGKSNIGKKGVLKKPGTTNTTELVPTQALDDSGAADTEADSDYESKPGKIPHSKLIPTQALDDSRGGDTEEDTEGNDDGGARAELAKRKREPSGLSDADTEPDNDSESYLDSKNSKISKISNSAKKVAKKTRKESSDSLQTLPYN